MTTAQPMMDPLFLSTGSETTSISDEELRSHLGRFLDSLGAREDVLLLPPDFTRFHSQAGKITMFICEHYGFIPSASSEAAANKEVSVPTIQILPALGTHAPMTTTEIRTMFGEELAKKNESAADDDDEDDVFLVHDWRNDVVTIGYAPPEMIQTATRGVVDRPWPAQLNTKVWSKRKTPPGKPRPLVLSIGQVVPHEVMGMANFNKNLFVGTGGVEAINLSHFIGAVCGMENMMGRKNNPLRDILNYASETFLEKELDLWYVLTVVAADETTGEKCIRGLYIGRDIRCYSEACDLSLKVNFSILERAIQRCVVYLDPDEFHSLWLGNKAIYRTRMAMANGGRLIILAPGVKRFGEDDKCDELIRKYGYNGTETTMENMDTNQELKDNLSAVAHLIHGSTEGRFEVTYCPGHLTKEEIESVGFDYDDLDTVSKQYDVSTLKDGWNEDKDGGFFFISNPALGLWAVQSRLS